MLTCQDPEGRNKKEDGRVGNDAPVVARRGFAPEGKGNRLRFGTAAEVQGAVPERGGGDTEPEAGGKAGGRNVGKDFKTAS